MVEAKRRSDSYVYEDEKDREHHWYHRKHTTDILSVKHVSLISRVSSKKEKPDARERGITSDLFTRHLADTETLVGHRLIAWERNGNHLVQLISVSGSRIKLEYRCRRPSSPHNDPVQRKSTGRVWNSNARLCSAKSRLLLEDNGKIDV